MVDYKKINDTVYYNLYTQSTSPFGSFTPNSDPDLRKPGKIITFDRNKAITLLNSISIKIDHFVAFSYYEWQLWK